MRTIHKTISLDTVVVSMEVSFWHLSV